MEDVLANPTPVLIYLAGPVDGVGREEALGWREAVAKEWPQIAFFSPPGAYLNDTIHTIRAIDHVSKFVISQSSGLLANLMGPGRGFGTIREIEFAALNQKPIAVVGDFSDTLMTYDINVAPSLERGMTLLTEEIAKKRNEPQTFLGFPLGLMRPADPEEEEHE